MILPRLEWLTLRLVEHLVKFSVVEIKVAEIIRVLSNRIVASGRPIVIVTVVSDRLCR